jgi:uncharacterized protein (DUF362 family)
MTANVALTRGDRRYDNIANALNLIADQIDLSERQLVLIKPNLVSTQRQLPSTHVEAVRAVLDFVRTRYAGRLVIAEGSAISPTNEGFERFGYRELVDRYDLELIDLNADETLPVQVYDRRLRPMTLHLARTVVESDYRISVSPPKTHDTVIVTLSIKNMIMGALVNRAVAFGAMHAPRPSMLRRVLKRLLRASYVPKWVRIDAGAHSDKLAMHQSFPIINLNLAMLAPWVKPQLAVLDGFQAMEGAGPVDGDPLDWRIATAGVDALAVDSLTSLWMGFDPAQIGYLDYCRRMGLGAGDPAQIEVLGEVSPHVIQRKFRPHPKIKQQRVWHLRDVEHRLQQALPVSI